MIRFVYDAGHWVTEERAVLTPHHRAQYDLVVPPALRHFLEACGAGQTSSDAAVIAYDGAEVVGAFRFHVHKQTLTAAGTWVARGYRGRGVASRLWEVALGRHPEVREVDVIAASGGGRSLVRSLARRFKTRRWYLDGRELDEEGKDKETC